MLSRARATEHDWYTRGPKATTRRHMHAFRTAAQALLYSRGAVWFNCHVVVALATHHVYSVVTPFL
jgi:hypothetical protein